MSLSAKKRLGLIVISALFFTISCKEKEKIGLLNPNQQIGVNYTDTFSIHTKAYLKNDSISYEGSSYLFAGAYSDPEFGDIAAEGYIQLVQAAENTDVSDFTSIESVVVTLAYDYHYGDTTESQTINVYKLTGAFSSDEDYFINHAPIAKEASIIDDDAVITLAPSTGVQKLYLDNSFGSEILSMINLGMSNSTFVSSFNGIALIPKNTNQGAIIRCKLFDNTSKITINYKVGTDSKSIDLLMNASAARFTRLVAARNTAPLSGLVNSGDEVDAMGKVYLQSGLGVNTKVFFPGLDNIVDSLGNVAVNRAELVVETDPSVTPDQLTEINVLRLIRLDANGNVKQILTPTGLIDHALQMEYRDVNGYQFPIQVGYNTTSNTYSFDISTYINAILIGELENNGLMIVSDPISNFRLNRSIGGEGSSSVKLKLYLTPVE